MMDVAWRAVLALLLILGPGAAACPAGGFDFAVVQPGQPGTTADAQPVMDALAAYVADKTERTAVRGRYFNQLAPALKSLAGQRPDWGIVGLGFYLDHARDLDMVPVAATRPGGMVSDAWTLVVGPGGPESWRNVTGEVLGTMLHDADAAACLLFGADPSDLPFELRGTMRPLSSLRKVVRGRLGGMVLDRLQLNATAALPLAGEIVPVHSVSGLPTSPVVWFGEPGPGADRLAEVLMSMADDPEAAALLTVLQTRGFEPPDPVLPLMLEECQR